MVHISDCDSGACVFCASLECVGMCNYDDANVCSTHAGLGESMYDQKPPSPKQIDTKGFLTDFGRNGRVK